MPNLAKVLKEEIQRLARKELKTSLEALRQDAAVQKKGMAQQNRRLAAIEEKLSQLGAGVAVRGGRAAVLAAEEAEAGARLTAKWSVRMRQRLGLSQAALARLLGLNTQTVYQWEHKRGPLTFRGDTRDRLLELSAMAKRDVQEKLAAITPARKRGRRAKRA